jgi:hypothetical protein
MMRSCSADFGRSMTIDAKRTIIVLLGDVIRGRNSDTPGGSLAPREVFPRALRIFQPNSVSWQFIGLGTEIKGPSSEA